MQRPHTTKGGAPGMDTRVALVKCGDYEGASLARALDEIEELLPLLGGMLPDSERVLIKPNLISAKKPEQAVTTHPALVAAVAQRLKARGYEVFIGDSPGGAIKGVERYWKKTGMLEAAEQSGAQLINFESAGSRTVDHKGLRYAIAQPILDFKFILNMPKLKTHVFAGLTGAVKNLFGSVPGLRKAALHQEAPHPAAFSRRMLDIYEIACPTFHLADGVMVLDTKGPSSGRVRPLDCLVASPDGVALDAVFAHLAGCTVKQYLTGAEARARGYPGVDLKNVELLGRDPDSMMPADFKVPNISLYRFIPSFLGPLSERFIRAWPVSNHACTGCGFCAESCPVDAIEILSEKASMDRKKCILCLCCHELCPEEAVDIQRSFLARRIFH